MLSVEHLVKSFPPTGRADGRPVAVNGLSLEVGEGQLFTLLGPALVVEPPLLLMDEPLSSLDAGLREEMRFELGRLQRELGVTAVYVTHDQAEALALSSIVAIMREGRIEQVGRPRDIYS